MKTYGNLVAQYHYNSNGNDGGLMDRTILVYETKTLFKVQEWNSTFKGWHGSNHKPFKETAYKKIHGYDSPDNLPYVVNAKEKYTVYTKG